MKEIQKGKIKSIKTKILWIPLICVAAGILIMGTITSLLTQMSMIEEMEQNGYASAQQFVDQIESNQKAIEALNTELDTQLRNIGNIIVSNDGGITNEYLTNLANQTGISSIYWYNPSGTVVNAADDKYLGWTVPADHPVYSFMQSGNMELMEDIRKDSESDNYFKYGYVRSASGYFVQIGIAANHVNALTNQFTHQALIEKLVESEQVVFSSFMNRDLIEEAASNRDDIGRNMADNEAIRKAALEGQKSAEEYTVDGQDVYIVNYPVEINGQLTGSMNIGYSMESIDAALMKNIVMTVTFELIIFALLGLVLFTVSNSITKPVRQVSQMLKEIRKGHLAVRVNMSRDDEIGEMADTLDDFADDLQHALVGTMNKIADGDVSMNLEIRDQEDEVTPALKNTVETIRDLIDEMTMLSTAAVAGNLETRGEAQKFSGGFKAIVDGVNETIDALVEPLNVAAGCIEKIGKGEIPAKIKKDYQGDFDLLKKNINNSIDGLGALEEGNRVLKMMSQNDLSQTIENDYQGIYGQIGSAINVVHRQLSGIVGIANNIAQGDLSDLELLKKTGKQSENDKLVPSLVGMIENIRLLVEETQLMAQKAVEGDLNSRGDESKVPGEYAKLIAGFNETLEAVTHPIQEALAVLKQLAQGNLNVTMEGDYQGDHAAIKEGMNQTVSNLRRYVSEISETLEKLSNGSVDYEISSNYDGDFQAIKTALNQISIQLSKTMSDINIAAFEVESGSKQISDGAQALAQGSTQQASSIQELTASIEDIAGETKRNAINANDANDRAVNVRSNAQTGNSQMENMMTAMADINESSNSISKIIKVIDDIAFQTNILALNAAVEAARAGEHGKGFAVVAEEVRTLAARCADAAKETTILIEGSIEKVEVGTKIADETAQSLKEILSEIGQVTHLVSTIAQASNDQAGEIAQVSRGIEQVSEVVQVNSATAEESAASSEELTSQAEMLKEMIGRFRLRKL